MSTFEARGTIAHEMKIGFRFGLINKTVVFFFANLQHDSRFQVLSEELANVVFLNNKIVILQNESKTRGIFHIDRNYVRITAHREAFEFATKLRQEQQEAKARDEPPFVPLENIDRYKIVSTEIKTELFVGARVPKPFFKGEIAIVSHLIGKKRMEISIDQLVNQGSLVGECVDIKNRMATTNRRFAYSKIVSVCDPVLVRAFMTLKSLEK